MNQEIKEEWIKALRSGEYTQAHHTLKSADGKYCCLGVLCDLHQKRGLGIWKAMGALAPYHYQKEDSHYGSLEAVSAFPSEEVLAWAEFEDTEPLWQLAKLNDQGESFEGIANKIETTL